MLHGHVVVVHARTDGRAAALKPLVERGAELVVGDLSDPGRARGLAEQVNAWGHLDAVIHNAAVDAGPALLPVNVVAPYLLTALIERPARLVYLSSGMHRGGRARLDGLDFAGSAATASYSDSKLLLTVVMAAVARRWPDVLTNAVDPGWAPTRMGGPNAPDDLRLGHVTQVWLATSTDPEALTSGGYWHHQRRQPTHPSVADEGFQEQLLAVLAEHTGVRLPHA